MKNAVHFSLSLSGAFFLLFLAWFAHICPDFWLTHCCSKALSLGGTLPPSLDFLFFLCSGFCSVTVVVEVGLWTQTLTFGIQALKFIKLCDSWEPRECLFIKMKITVASTFSDSCENLRKKIYKGTYVWQLINTQLMYLLFFILPFQDRIIDLGIKNVWVFYVTKVKKQTEKRSHAHKAVMMIEVRTSTMGTMKWSVYSRLEWWSNDDYFPAIYWALLSIWVCSLQ